MEIKTKYKIGDHHWCIKNNKICECAIQAILIEQEAFDYGLIVRDTIQYRLADATMINEDKIVPTKQDLLNSL